jgi:aconitate hydratase
VNFGVVPMTFAELADHDWLEQGETLRFEGLHTALRDGRTIAATRANGTAVAMRHRFSPRQVELLLSGGVINWLRGRLAA